MTARRFPPPWTAELQPNHYVVRDANRQQLAYVYYEKRTGATVGGEIAQRIVANIAKLLELLKKP